MKRSVVLFVLVILAAWIAGGYLDQGTPAGAPTGASRCLLTPRGIYHPYFRAGSRDWQSTVAFVPTCEP